METPKQENKPQATKDSLNVQDAVNSFLNTSKAIRYQKQTETLMGKSLDGLMGELGMSENTRREVFSGNSTDKRVVFGLVLANVELKPEAKKNIITELAKEQDSE